MEEITSIEEEWGIEGYESAEQDDDDKSVFSDDEIENADDRVDEDDDGADEYDGEADEDDEEGEDGEDDGADEDEDAIDKEEESTQRPRSHLLESLAAQARSARRKLEKGNCTAYTEKNSQAWIDLEAV